MSNESLATRDCRTCRTRRIKCDRHLPTCEKCRSRNYDCPGYGPRLKWVEGVASRGKLKGHAAPVPLPLRRPSTIVKPVAISELSKAKNDVPLAQINGLNSSNEIAAVQNPEIEKPPLADTRMVLSPAQHTTAPLPGILQNPTVYRLLSHYNQIIASQLAWVDTQENPWRNLIVPLAFGSPLLLFSILALTSADLSHRLKSSPSPVKSDEFQKLSDNFRERAMILLARRLQNERLTAENNSLLVTDQKSTNPILAAIIVLCNLEMKQPESAVYRLHLKAARTMIRRWGDTAQHLPQPTDETSLFLLHEFYTTNVWNSMTIFDPDEMTRDTLVSDSDTIFIEFVRVVQDISTIIQQRLLLASALIANAQPLFFPPIDYRSLISRLATAESRTLSLSQTLNFKSDAARRQFIHLVSIFHQCGLLYVYRIPYPTHHSNSIVTLSNCTLTTTDLQSLIADARTQLFAHLYALTDITIFAQDLVWPLMIAGTESVGLPADQLWVETKMREVMRASGYMDRPRVLLFLKTFWRLGEEGDRSDRGRSGSGSGSGSGNVRSEVSWMEVAREWAARGNSFLVL